jgi:excinuclease ABC subunit B
MQRAMDETNRRRELQVAYNQVHGIVPKTIYRSREEIIQSTSVLESVRGAEKEGVAEPDITYEASEDAEELVEELEKQMKKAAEGLEFEKAAHLRDEITRLRVEQVD